MQWWEFRRSTWFVKPRAGRAWATSDRRTGRRRCHVTYECRPPRPERSTAWRKMHTGLWRSGSRSECLSSEHTTTEINSIWLNLYLTKLTRRGSHKYKCSDFKCVRKATKSRRAYLSAISDRPTYVEDIRLFSCLFTALHVMQTRYSDKNSVFLSICPSVRPSVRLSHTEERSVKIFIPYERF